jgi:hypothetical protein
MITLNTHSNLMLPAIHYSSTHAKRNGHWRMVQVDHFGVACSVCGYDAGLNPETGQVYIECPNCKAVNVKMYQK